MWKRLLKWVGEWLLKEAVEEVQEKVSSSDRREAAKETRRTLKYGKRER